WGSGVRSRKAERSVQRVSSTTRAAEAAPLPTTLGALRTTGHVHQSVKAELRANLLARLSEGQERFPGIVGFDETVLPQVERAILAGHDVVLLGEPDQSADEPGCEIN